MHKQSIHYRSLHKMGYCSRMDMGCFISLSGTYSLLPPTTNSCRYLYMHTLASVADPRLFDPRVGDDKTYITTLGMQQTFAHRRTLNATGQAGKQDLVDLFHFVRVYYLTTEEWKEFLPGSSLSFWITDISVVLLPCAVSSTSTWVNQLLTLVQ